jgi:thymidine phosphorylase
VVGGARAARALAQGAAAETFQRWCASQGGDWRTRDGHRLGAADVQAPRGGLVTTVDALLVGRAAQAAGAGRRRVDDAIDHAAGVVLAHRLGDAVEEGELLATAYARDRSRRQSAAALLAQAFAIGSDPSEPGPLVLGRTTARATPGEGAESGGGVSP